MNNIFCSSKKETDPKQFQKSIQNLYVCTVNIICSTKEGERTLNWHFLAEKQDGKLRDIYSKCKDIFIDDISVEKYFKRNNKNVLKANIQNVTSVADYFKLSDQYTIDVRKLFEFVTDMNIAEKRRLEN